ncbi:hypothetical protein FRC20_000315 [Serendipita sp. 405]|nr:hypothetical protein FRC20_000315 [Serendipita sp. 405]
MSNANKRKSMKIDPADAALQATIDGAASIAWKENNVSKLQSGMDKVGVEEANVKLENLGDTVQSIDEGVNMLKLLRVLDSPREKELWKLVKQKGGPKACLEDDNILKELATSRSSQLQNSQGVVDNVKLGEVKQSLKEDVDKSLTANFTVFEKKLELQRAQLVSAMDRIVQRESDRVLSAITSGPHDRVVDKDLHLIWKEMGWKSSVKARHFVLAVHDYFIQKLSAAAAEQERHETGTVYSEDGGGAAASVVSGAPPKTEHHDDDSWTLDFINLSRVPAILEAFDDDGSGFINVVEVNQFTSSRPKNWSLLHWIAYWAEGWHYTIWDYRSKIGSILNAMEELLDSGDTHQANQSLVDYYLMSEEILQIDQMVHSVARYTEENTYTLEEKIRPYVDEEEERLRANLNRVGWNIDGFDTLTLVTGPGRIERYLFPLLYLVLDRHLRVLRRASEEIFNPSELHSHSQTLTVIMEAAMARMRTLLAVLRQRSSNPGILLGNVAFGMFKLLNDPSMNDWYINEDEYDEFPTLEEGEEDDGEEDEESSKEPKLLNFPPLKSLVNSDGYEEITRVEADQQDDVTADGLGLQGMWTGYTVDSEGTDTDGLTQLHIKAPDGDKIQGIGMNKFGIFHIEGQITPAEGTQHKIRFNFIYKASDEPGAKEAEGGEEDGGENKEENEGEDEAGNEGGTQADAESESDTPKGNEDNVAGIYDGIFDTATLTINGTWINGDGNETGTFNLSRRPVFACQFKYTQPQFEANPAWARWSYALAAIRQQVQTRLWSWNYLKARVDTRKRYVELRLRQDTENYYSVHPDVELTEQEKVELNSIEQGLPPPEVRYYQSLVNEAAVQRCIHHGYSCDGCDAALIGARMICLTCVSDNYVDNMDFCDLCFDVTKSDRGFNHYPEHDSLVMFQVLPRRARRDKINRAREFASFGRTSLEIREGDLLCVSCSTPVSLPCWLCYDCDNEAYICVDCQQKDDATYTNYNHTSSHAIIRLSDTSTLGKSLEATVEALDSRLSKDIADVHGRMDKLEEMIKGYESGVNEKITSLEVLVQQRLSKVEELLMQILSGAQGQHSA